MSRMFYAGDDEGATRSDAEQTEVERMLYEQKRPKGAALREACAKRKLKSPTLMEAIEQHLRTQPTFTRAAMASPAPACNSRRNPQRLTELAAIVNEIIDDDLVLPALVEAAALTSTERLAKFGWLVNLPHAALATLPAEMRDPAFKFHAPAWLFAQKFDPLRDEIVVDVLLGKIDGTDALVRRKEYRAAKLAARPIESVAHKDEAVLSTAVRKPLSKLRARWLLYSKTAVKYPMNTYAVNEAVRALAEIRQLRADAGLPAVPPANSKVAMGIRL
ncbi:MAG: hypothetical protein WD051_14035 [Steroidobacteraceae bacterium]